MTQAVVEHGDERRGKHRVKHRAVPSRVPRPQPIRDAIIALLSGPEPSPVRSASEVAAHIGRSVPIATGHLAAMRRRGLVLRLGYSAYALAGYAGPAVDRRIGRRRATAQQPKQ